MRHGDDHHHDGLTADLKTLAAQSSRRKVLGWLAGATLLPLLGCEDTNGGACAAIPEETAGPYPGDGTNGANALVLDGIVRSDIRSSIAGLSGTAEGIPLTVTLTIVPNNPTGLAPGRHNAALLAARNKWLRRLGAEGVFAAADVANALQEPLLARRRAAPRLAPHLSRRLVQELYRAAGARSNGTSPRNTSPDFRSAAPAATALLAGGAGGVRSTLVRATQAKAEDLVDQHGDKVSDGIDKAADLLDEKTGGKLGDKADLGAEKAKDALDSLDGKNDDLP